MLIGERAQYEILVPSASSIVNAYVTGPEGISSVQREYTFPHTEDADGASLIRTSELRYVFTTPKLLSVGYYDIENLTDFGPQIMGRLHVNDVTSGELRKDLGAP
ncbi:MAG: hypothetical protein ABFD89_17790 [Bryobacteraceae bacterium]